MLAIRPLLSFLRRSFNVAGTCKGTRLNAVNALLGNVCVSLRGSLLFLSSMSSFMRDSDSGRRAGCVVSKLFTGDEA